MAILATVLVSLIIGSLLGHPIVLSYIETGSMEPTMTLGEGFVALLPEATGEIEAGNVIVFEGKEIQGGGLTTHQWSG